MRAVSGIQTVARRRLSVDSNVDQSVVAKLLWAREDGSPVAPSSDSLAEDMTAIARRRWNSYRRRNPSVDDTLENRVNDLARGLATRFELGGWPMVGPLISDYKWLAEQIAPILAGEV